MIRVEWFRVNRHHPCEICDHDDWCTYSDLGVCCMRIESPKPLKNGGWLHRAGSSTVEQAVYNRQKRGSTPAPPIRNFGAMIDHWRNEKAGELEAFAATLGVQQQDLIDLHTCWASDYRAFAFPMYDAGGNVTGIRLRNNRYKWSVTGSHPGLFIPFRAIRRVSLDLVLITEGPTDTAAALSLGFFAIGRPACRGQEQLVIDVLEDLSVQKVVLVIDNDEHYDSRGKLIKPGAMGADSLRKMIPYPFRVSNFIPPTKDLRDFVTSGGTRDLLLSVITAATRA